MDIPADILDELKCSSCETYLSRGPVFLQHDGAGVCGRCYTPKRPVTRNTQYEATAKLLKYPRRYREFGCPETVPFVQEAEVIAHEEVCEHQNCVCPVLGSARCDWLGPRAVMLAHCRDQYPDNVLENPCSLTHDITKASLQNYIISAFHLLFLMHTKVCVTSGKIVHAVRLLGGSVEASDFFFNLNIKRNDELVSKKGPVTPLGCLAIQDDTSLALDINCLLGVLGGLDDTTFTVTVKQRMSDAADHLPITMDKCGNCKAAVTVFLYRDCNGWRCKRCVPSRRACTQGCSHTDIAGKCRKHETYFCQQNTTCHICKAVMSQGSLSAHYVSVHQDITHQAGSTWWASDSEMPFCLVSTDAGTAVCEYYLKKSKFKLYIYTSISSERLREFRCSVRVTDPATGHARTFTPDAVYSTLYDWRLVINKDEFSSWNVTLDVCVNITNI